MSDMYNSEEQYQDPVPPHEVAPVDGPPPPPPPPADVAPDVAPPAPPAPPAEVAPPAPPVDVAPPAPPADPYAGEVVPTDPGMPPDLPPDAPPPPPVTGHEGHSYEDPSAVIGAGQPGGPPAYEPVVEQQADEVMQEIEELPEAPPAAPSEPDQQPWLDMGSDAEPVDYGGQQPWPDMGSDAGYVSLDPVELSGCAGMCQQVSGEYEDVAAQLTVTPQLESFAPSLIDTLEALRQSLQALAGELSGEAGNLQQAGNVVQDDGSLPLSSYSAPAFGDSAASAAWGSGSDASAVIGAGQPGGPAAAPVSFDPNIAVVGGNPFGEVTIVDGGGGSDYGGLLNALQGNTVVGGNWSSSPTDYTFTLSDNYDYAAGLANAEASLNASGYMSDVTALLNTPRAPMSVNDIILNNIGLQGIRTMNQSLFGTYSLFPPTPSPFF